MLLNPSDGSIGFESSGEIETATDPVVPLPVALGSLADGDAVELPV
jgi:hypothetical protein